MKEVATSEVGSVKLPGGGEGCPDNDNQEDGSAIKSSWF